MEAHGHNENAQSEYGGDQSFCQAGRDPMGFSIRWVMWLKAPIIRVTVPRSPSTSANVTMMFK